MSHSKLVNLTQLSYSIHWQLVDSILHLLLYSDTRFPTCEYVGFHVSGRRTTRASNTEYDMQQIGFFLPDIASDFSCLPPQMFYIVVAMAKKSMK